MSESPFLKSSCQHCEGHIEFPAEGAGMSIDCPHCGQRTTLVADTSVPPSTPMPQPTLDSIAPVVAPARPRVGGAIGMIATVAVVIVLVGLTTVGFVFYARQPKDRRPGLSTPSAPESRTESRSSEPEPAPAPAPASDATETAGAKSIDDLKVGNLTLEKARGTSLVYAVGTLRNESDHQRFGVKIELELLDAAGDRVGVAKDYRPTLEPRQSWRFRALVLDNRATSARVASVEEDQ